MNLAPDAWFTKIFGYPVFRVTPQGGDDDVEKLVDHARGQSRAFYYAKAPVDQIGPVRSLSAAGFYVVDVNVTFRYEGSEARFESPYVIRRAEPRDAEEILAIAGSTFRYSRFHLDPRVSDELANRIKREWIASYCEGRRGEALWIAVESDRPVGFFAVAALDGVRRIDLIGVARGQERKGIGRALTSFFIEQYREQSSRLEVGTQIANVPSTRLYENLGFRLAESAFVLHKHVS